MAKQCWIESCRNRAEEYCYHCSQDVCHHHFIKHKKWLQEQVLPLIRQVNVMFSRVQRCHMDQTMFALSSLSDARHQLNQWRSHCIRHIDDVYDQALQEIEETLEDHKQEMMEKNRQNLDLLSELRRQLGELLSNSDIAYAQMQSMKQQLEEIKRQEQKLSNHPDIRIVTDKLEAEKYVHVIYDRTQLDEEQQQETETKMAFFERNPIRLTSSDDSDEEQHLNQRLVKKTFAYKKLLRPSKLPSFRHTREITQPKRNSYRDRVAYANEHTRKKLSS